MFIDNWIYWRNKENPIIDALEWNKDHIKLYKKKEIINSPSNRIIGRRNCHLAISSAKPEWFLSSSFFFFFWNVILFLRRVLKERSRNKRMVDIGKEKSQRESHTESKTRGVKCELLACQILASSCVSFLHVAKGRKRAQLFRKKKITF